uniref:LYR motif-containing protein Cup1-like N-terminal domain-containing protein n=1 Tax=Mycena chlorophos TaxID=658473 RepID=A0ABQ0LBF3_MYCCL|nr:predicted protein [Mycena chlorophos]
MFASFDDVRALLSAEDARIRHVKFKRLRKDVRRLEAANSKTITAFKHILDVAYGRKGKLKRELMEPLLTDPNAALPVRIIPTVESSRPPVYSPELRALLTSSASRPAAVLKSTALDHPPTLPARADPKSEDARLFGPLSKRREVNIRWRFFVKESRKVHPPLHVAVDSGARIEDVHSAGIRSLPMQSLRAFEDAERHASSPYVPRWVRRRFRGLLDRLPVLHKSQKSQAYSVNLSDHRQTKPRSTVDTDESDVQWL